MTYKKGIDVSVWQGAIDWSRARNDINFAIIRAGYGANSVDKRAEENMRSCKANNIPFGAYWFSYAYTVEMAKNEARKCIQAVRAYKPDFPIYFDYEYDSVIYGESKGANITPALVRDMATAFCDTVKAEGYECGIYSNVDFINRYFGTKIFDKYPLWLAKWSKDMGDFPAHMWQYSDTGSVRGISGNVDMNYLIKLTNNTENISTVQSQSGGVDLNAVARSVVYGKFGNGEERRKKLKQLGYDYNAVQKIINEWYDVAKAVIRGRYGNGEERKTALRNSGYDYDVIQKIVNSMLRGE